jgi:dihydropteroate synthase
MPFVAERSRPPPLWMGILNLTPDSFSDGGRYLDPSAALDRALELEADGANVLDVGAESTRPGHAPVPADEECRRLLPVLDRLAGRLRIPISVDTSKAEVARAAFDRGAGWLNDVAALANPGMADFARSGNFPVVLMHGVAHTLAENDPHPSRTVADWLDARIDQLGIDRRRLLVDPGIGFGTTRPQDAALLDDLSALAELGPPILVGLSRKRIVRVLRPDADPDLASAELALAASRRGAGILRLHDLKFLKSLPASALSDPPECPTVDPRQEN